jgi:anaerobic magnesium-protoporphyrin IX monomethyl ester cyclase
MDLLLIFVPQWSPFQPPLSLPSLAAWLRRAGYKIHCLDANILLYEWLLSDDCADLLLDTIELSDMPRTQAEGFRAIIKSRGKFRSDLANLHVPDVGRFDKQSYVQKHYFAIKSFSAYLEAVSAISGDFLISPFSFRMNIGSTLSSESLEDFAKNPPKILGRYVQWLTHHYIAPRSPRAIGLSCIGEEQLAFTLIFGKAMKERFPDSPVFVGGTILSRIFERGVLKRDWFDTYFDVVVRNEGEKPCERLLSNLILGRSLVEEVPGIVYSSHSGLQFTEPAQSLKPHEVPVPDFDDLPLGNYICSEITLPVLSSRGCYWGKCEFCHHYMVYGDKYSAYDAEKVVNIIHELAQKYNVRHFAFNDEAIPPKIVRSLGQMLPSHENSDYTFTGLIKFEKYFTQSDFGNLSRVGFRSLYIGLESASEAVLALMKKPNKLTTITRNLYDATKAGIWTHCFLFFGFPGETEADAAQTYDFVMENSDIIGSFGGGTFVLEHNAPIQRHPELFKLEVDGGRSRSDISVYYNYAVSDGITRQRAQEWSDRLDTDSLGVTKYRATTWIPREFLLCLISRLTPDELAEECAIIDRVRGLPPLAIVSDLVSLVSTSREFEAFAVNRMRGNVVLVKNNAWESLTLCIENSVKAVNLADMDHRVAAWLALGIRPPVTAADGDLDLSSTEVERQKIEA